MIWKSSVLILARNPHRDRALDVHHSQLDSLFLILACIESYRKGLALIILTFLGHLEHCDGGSRGPLTIFKGYTL